MRNRNAGAVVAPWFGGATLLLILVLAACGTPGKRSKAELAGELAQRMLVLPLNVVTTLPNELEEPSAMVWQELEAYLGSHGKQVQTLSLIDARDLWHESIEQVRMQGESRGGFKAAAKAMTVELAKHSEFDVVIIPSLFITQARMRGRSASWGGVRRTVELGGEPLSAGSIVITSSLGGTIRGASIHVVVCDAQGIQVHEGSGGLDLLDLIYITGKESDPIHERPFGPQSRLDPFSDPKHINEGVRRAFAPFLSRR
jgi:hypothetical protein